MPEEQAFSVLVKIMFDYGLRDLFKQNFEDLHCKFFQLERLMQVDLVLALDTKEMYFLIHVVSSKFLHTPTDSCSFSWL